MPAASRWTSLAGGPALVYQAGGKLCLLGLSWGAGILGSFSAKYEVRASSNRKVNYGSKRCPLLCRAVAHTMEVRQKDHDPILSPARSSTSPALCLMCRWCRYSFSASKRYFFNTWEEWQKWELFATVLSCCCGPAGSPFCCCCAQLWGQTLHSPTNSQFGGWSLVLLNMWWCEQRKRAICVLKIGCPQVCGGGKEGLCCCGQFQKERLH